MSIVWLIFMSVLRLQKTVEDICCLIWTIHCIMKSYEEWLICLYISFRMFLLFYFIHRASALFYNGSIRIIAQCFVFTHFSTIFRHKRDNNTQILSCEMILTSAVHIDYHRPPWTHSQTPPLHCDLESKAAQQHISRPQSHRCRGSFQTGSCLHQSFIHSRRDHIS